MSACAQLTNKRGVSVTERLIKQTSSAAQRTIPAVLACKRLRLRLRLQLRLRRGHRLHSNR